MLQFKESVICLKICYAQQPSEQSAFMIKLFNSFPDRTKHIIQDYIRDILTFDCLKNNTIKNRSIFVI